MKRLGHKKRGGSPVFQGLESRTLLSAGGLVTSFGASGYYFNSIHANGVSRPVDGSDYAMDAALADSRIVVAGSVDGNSSFGVVCYDVTGVRVSDFGSSGQAVISLGDKAIALATCVAVDSQDRILVGGAVLNSGFLSAVVVRLNTQGELDSTFAEGGVLRLDNTGYAYGSASRVMVNGDDGITVVGRAGKLDEGNEDWAVWRYQSDGGVDGSFGTNGRVVVDLGGMDQAIDAARDLEGNIYIVGASQRQDDVDQPWKNTGFWAAKITPQGAMDGTFGTEGVLHIATDNPSFAARLALGAEGSLFIAGPSVYTNQSYVAKALADGQLDSTYANGGMATINGMTTVLGLEVSDTNAATVVGYASRFNTSNLEVGTLTLRAHLLPDGQADVSYGLNGITAVRHTLSVRLNKTAVFLPNGNTLMVGSGQTHNQQGKSNFGFLTAMLKPDRADSNSGQAKPPALPVVKAKISGNVLTLTGTNVADEINLSLKNPTTLKAVLNGKETLYSLKKIAKIAVNAGDGDDYVNLNDVKIPTVVHGGGGNDTLIGGIGKDVLCGDEGNDALDGSLGNDVLHGGAGDDYLFGGMGSGTDSLFGEEGDDCFKAGKGADNAYGGAGADYTVSTGFVFGISKLIEG